MHAAATDARRHKSCRDKACACETRDAARMKFKKRLVVLTILVVAGLTLTLALPPTALAQGVSQPDTSCLNGVGVSASGPYHVYTSATGIVTFGTDLCTQVNSDGSQHYGGE